MPHAQVARVRQLAYDRPEHRLQAFGLCDVRVYVFVGCKLVFCL